MNATMRPDKLPSQQATFSFTASYLSDNREGECYCLFIVWSDPLPVALVFSVCFNQPPQTLEKWSHTELDHDFLRESLLKPTWDHADNVEALPSLPQVQKASEIRRFVLNHGSASLSAEDERLIASLLEEVNRGVTHHAPKLVDEGEGGTYFLYSESGAPIGVFKPTDEDPQADNNPKRRASEESGSPAESDKQRARLSIPYNETAVREAAAYAIDRGYAGVPPTFLVEVKHPQFNNNHLKEEEIKLGSIQQFVESESASWDACPTSFSVRDVHRIGIFDIRTFNTDRHGGNILCKRKKGNAQPKGKVQYDLVPIDHAYCFPTSLSEANWEWLYWPQAKVPFSEEELRYINSIDIDSDVALLSCMGLSAEAVRVYRLTTTLLKKGAALGLTLYELGKLCYRGKNDSDSQLEATIGAASLDESSADFNERIVLVLEDLCLSHCRANNSSA